MTVTTSLTISSRLYLLIFLRLIVSLKPSPYYVLERNPFILACTAPPETWSSYLWTWIIKCTFLRCLSSPLIYHRFLFVGFPVTLHHSYYYSLVNFFFQLFYQGDHKEGTTLKLIMHIPTQGEI